MRILTTGALAAACLVVLSCGGGSAKTAGTTFEDFKAKLESLKKPGKVLCTECDGYGNYRDPDTGEQKACPKCKGTGYCDGIVHPSQEDFEAAFGKPDKQEKKDINWSYWFYPCKEGTIRLPARLIEPRGEPIRVVTGEPELIEE